MLRLIGGSGLVVSLASVGAVWGCSYPFYQADCRETRSCSAAGAGAEAGVGGDPSIGDGGGAQAGHEGTGITGGESAGGSGSERGCQGEVSDDAACWATNEWGVFVSADSGSDAEGDGTKEKPFATISRGLREWSGKNVYVCSSITKPYLETVVIGPDEDGVHLYGGFDCDDWSYRADRFAPVEAPPASVALRVHDLESGAKLENLSFSAPDAPDPGQSSIAALITASKGVELRRVRITSGAGAPGKSGEPGSVGENGAAPGAFQVGEDSTCANHRLPGSLPAPICGSLGGMGGEAATTSGALGGSGAPLTKVSPPNNANGGLLVSVLGQAGHDGDPGSLGDAGIAGQAAAAQGTLDAQGYTPADGSSGAIGFPGQGGGGGSGSKGAGTAKLCFGATGGAGGMGGCAGSPGQGGLGGGASIGLLSWQSAVVLTDCEVRSGTGGAGGAGGHGGAGGQGGLGGKGGSGYETNGIAAAGHGGLGGDGGPGGSGSGGSGGPSFAVAFRGTEPVNRDTIIKPGNGGKAGVGGKITGSLGPNGSVGATEAVHKIP